MKREFNCYFNPFERGPKTPDQKPDWKCTKCGTLNGYSHTHCRKAGCEGKKP